MIRRSRPGHRDHCPVCLTITDANFISDRAVVTCCSCGTRFTKRPWLAPFLPKVGVACPVHKSTGGAK